MGDKMTIYGLCQLIKNCEKYKQDSNAVNGLVNSMIEYDNEAPQTGVFKND